DVGRPDGLDGFGDPAMRLVEPATDLGPKPQRQRRPRGGGQLPDGPKAEFPETVQGIGVEPQRCDWQAGNRGRGGADWRDGHVVGGEARQCMAGAPGVRNSSPDLKPRLTEPRDDVG